MSAVLVPAMGPERVFPTAEDEDKSPCDGGLAAGAVWSGGEEEEGGGQVDLEEDEANNAGGYSYQPLSQDGDDGGEAPSHGGSLQHRMEVMGLHLPEAPPPDSDEEEDPEGAAAERSHASIPMDAAHVELVKRTMATVALPSLGVPPWAREISDDQWRDVVQRTLQSRHGVATMQRTRCNNT
ncbi:male-enhanced antigen 1 isoform X1 [Dunckerocampus dactyliophorus]|uniref:male-enhanced antigen 1 isoform X1 n=2 Tax=Dunckerocampus dactyliophorus TaxID=161453 RepID=UPI002405F7CE|nr:male-enhanced antigen 1 isoform X1 [Dunckerocampus dactyliophorus]